jgi:hypothetical protein
MKSKELSKQVRDKVGEKYRSGLAYIKISEEIEVSVHSTTLSHTLHRAGLYGRVTRKNNCLKKRLVFAKRQVGDYPNIWKKVLWSE